MARRRQRRGSDDVDVDAGLIALFAFVVVAGALVPVVIEVLERNWPIIVAGTSALVTIAIYLWRRRRQQRRMERATLGGLLALSSGEFEEAVGDILSGVGYRHIRRVGGARDLAADLVARDRAGRGVVIQCKRYAPGQRVGSGAIQTFIGMVHVHHPVASGIFVTTSSFTPDAVALARRHGLRLIDGPELVRLAELAAGLGTMPAPQDAENLVAGPADRHSDTAVNAVLHRLGLQDALKAQTGAAILSDEAPKGGRRR